MELDQKPTVVAYSWLSHHDYQIYQRLNPALAANGYRLVLVTHLLSAWIRAQMDGIPCILMEPTDDASPRPGATPESFVEVKLGRIRWADSCRFQNSLWQALDKARLTYGMAGLCQWNGLYKSGPTVTAYAKAHGIPTVFLELANIGSKLFADPEGINSGSRIARMPQLLESSNISDEELRQRCSEYADVLVQASKKLPPQSLACRRINPWYLLDYLGFMLLRIPRSEYISLVEKLAGKIRIWTADHPPTAKPDRPYVFLPLQVSSDTNLVKYSDYDNLAALKYAEEFAAKHGLLLAVKPHPAETNTRLIDEIRKVCAARGHLLTSYNTSQLVYDAAHVITINSTVGLEALLLDKPLTVLGASLYGRFTQRDAYAYMSRYIIDFKPSGQGPASKEAGERILRTMNLEPIGSKAEAHPAQ